nr:Sec-independent protein translocase protein (TatC) [uncultured bacterium]
MGNTRGRLQAGQDTVHKAKLIDLLAAMINSEQFEQQPLSAHLAELRSCLIISLAAVAVCFVLAYAVVEDLADWFLQPLISVLPAGKSLIFTSYQAGFFFI